jgi:hypothetical protein
MSRWLIPVLALVVLWAAPAGADGLRGSGAGFGLGSISADRYRQPQEARIKIDRARRALSGDSSIDAFRTERALDELDFDARRSARYGTAPGVALSDGGLLRADEALLPFPRSLRDRQPVYGTAKSWVRLGSLLQGAETGLSGGDIQRARSLLEEARALHGSLIETTPASMHDDPQIVGTEGRLTSLEKQLGS